ncbi:Regulator of G-protein signaling 3 [Dissostichus eleginoides]|uniref:Regulator of G-protein signaling 3 n=1 Tax=Dissostichus eleginoides TaxID=100907 RepID=A0AAD9B4S9_DISEL|nr:Regulator of G-protein signaling 3 [Dissostichus eleginoides]
MGKSQRSCDSFVEHQDENSDHPQQEPRIQDHTHSQVVGFSVKQARQLIGCMSFGIGSLVSSSQLITGWFYLLGEEFGRSKHLRVTSQRSRPMRSQEEVQVNLVLYGGISPQRGSVFYGDQFSKGISPLRGSVLYGDQFSKGISSLRGSVLYGDQSSVL